MMAPPYDFLKKSFIPLVNKMGVEIDMKLHSWGFYPAGGGKIEVSVKPAEMLMPLKLEKRGDTKSKKCRAVVSALPALIAERELNQVKRKLNWKDDELLLEKVEKPVGPGNIMLFELGYDKMYLESASQLKSAIAMYEAYGFEYLDHRMGDTGHYACGVWMLKHL